MSARDARIVQLATTGMTNVAIADLLGIHTRTVERAKRRHSQENAA